MFPREYQPVPRERFGPRAFIYRINSRSSVKSIYRHAGPPLPPPIVSIARNERLAAFVFFRGILKTRVASGILTPRTAAPLFPAPRWPFSRPPIPLFRIRKRICRTSNRVILFAGFLPRVPEIPRANGTRFYSPPFTGHCRVHWKRHPARGLPVSCLPLCFSWGFLIEMMIWSIYSSLYGRGIEGVGI